MSEDNYFERMAAYRKHREAGFGEKVIYAPDMISHGKRINIAKNIYHRYLKLPVVFNKPKMFEKDLENNFITYMGKDVVQQDFIDWLSKYNLKVSNVVEGFFTKTNGSIPVHNDTTIKLDIKDACKINFTWGPSNSVTRWWRVKDESKLKEIVHDTTEVNKGLEEAGVVPDIDCYKCYSANKEDLDLVHEAVIDKPSLMNVGQLHDTYNPDAGQSRWTLSFTILNNTGEHLSFNEALELFKEVVYE